MGHCLLLEAPVSETIASAVGHRLTIANLDLDVRVTFRNILDTPYNLGRHASDPVQILS